MMLPIMMMRFEVGNSATKKNARKNMSGFPVVRQRTASSTARSAAAAQTATVMRALAFSQKDAAEPNTGTRCRNGAARFGPINAMPRLKNR